MRIVQTVYALHCSKQIAICSIDATADGFDFHFEIDNLPSPNFFLPLSQKLVFAISSLFAVA